MAPYEFIVPFAGTTPAPEDWSRLMRGGRFPGNIDDAVTFLTQVQQGIDFVRDDTRQKGLELTHIDIGISFDRIPFCYEFGPDMGVPKYGHVVMVPDVLLKAASQHGRRATPPKPATDITRDVLHDEFWFLDGVEEADHARFRQLSGKPHAKFQGTDTATPEYDAQQHEYEALFTRLRAARGRNMPQICIRAIETRIALAQVWRKKHGLA